MKSSSRNVAGNKLPAGVTDDEIQAAIQTSGYPLQLKIASKLVDQFRVTEEWSYVDKTKNELRSLDIAAYLQLYPNPVKTEQKVFPGLQLLIECKRSDLPYVFFKAATTPSLSDFPQIHGLRSKDIELIAAGVRASYPTARVLGLDESALVSTGPPLCATFSKAVRAKKLELSGSEAFNTVILPLVSALEHSYRENTAPRQSQYYFPVIDLAVCVVEAPMVLVDVVANESTLEPWVRVVRHEVTAKRTGVMGGTGAYVVDIVHAEFFSEFVEKSVLPLAQLFGERTEDEFLLLHNMTGHVPHLVNWTWKDVRDPSGA